MTAYVDEMPVTKLRDWMNFALGKKLGTGYGRDVFVYDPDPKLVIKVEHHGYQNAVEREIWLATQKTQYAKWFAPVRHISPYGSVLLMARTVPAPRSAYPKKMPYFLGDLKYSNFGLLNGRLVCHDYGTVSNFLHGVTGTIRYRKADWWDAEDGSTFDDSGKT